MNEKNVVAQFLSLNRHQTVDILRLFEKKSRDISRDVLKGDNFFMFAKFWFSAIIYVELIAEYIFSTGKLTNFRSQVVRIDVTLTRLSSFD